MNSEIPYICLLSAGIKDLYHLSGKPTFLGKCCLRAVEDIVGLDPKLFPGSNPGSATKVYLWDTDSLSYDSVYPHLRDLVKGALSHQYSVKCSEQYMAHPIGLILLVQLKVCPVPTVSGQADPLARMPSLFRRQRAQRTGQYRRCHIL